VTDDIVTRLNIDAAWLETCSPTIYQDIASIVREAADEIERLREDRDRWKALGQHICEFHYNLIPDHIHQLFDDYNKAVRGE
jgi:hypothetical protein